MLGRPVSIPGKRKLPRIKLNLMGIVGIKLRLSFAEILQVVFADLCQF